MKVQKKRFPTLFQFLGLIFIRPDRMADLKVIPGDFVVCQNASASFLFRVGLPVDGLFSGIDCEALVEEIYNLSGNIEINRIEEENLPVIRKVFIENAAIQKIDSRSIARVKNYLVRRRFPINDRGCVIVESQLFFFRKVKHPGVIIDSSEIACLQTFLDKEIERLRKQKRDLGRKISEIEESITKIDKLFCEKSKELEAHLSNLEQQIAERKEVIRCKQGQISGLKQEIDKIKEEINKKRYEEEQKKFSEGLTEIIKSFKGK